MGQELEQETKTDVFFGVGKTFSALLLLVALAPLPFGSVYPWSWTLMGAVTGLLVICLWYKSYYQKKRPRLALKSIWPIAAMFFAFILIGIFQTVTFLPASADHSFWSLASASLGMGINGSISINPEITTMALIKPLAYGGIFWLAYQYSGRQDRALLIIRLVAWVGTAYAAYGLMAYFAGASTILWFKKFAYLNDCTSTFVNRNSYATYAGLSLICVTALMIKSIARLLRYSSSWRERLRRFLEDMTVNVWFPFLGWFILITSLLFSHSRAGFASTVIGLAALTLAFGKTKMLRRKSDIFLWTLPMVLVLIVFAISGGGLDKRLAETSLGAEERPVVYQLTLEGASRTPTLGTGYGTFEEVFRSYRTPELKNFYLKAHNTYLEVLLEMGILGLLLIVGIHLGLLFILLKGVLNRKRGFIFPCVGIAATALIAAHSLVDFSIQIPAVAATYWLLMGASCAQSFSSVKQADQW